MENSARRSKELPISSPKGSQDNPIPRRGSHSPESKKSPTMKQNFAQFQQRGIFNSGPKDISHPEGLTKDFQTSPKKMSKWPPPLSTRGLGFAQGEPHRPQVAPAIATFSEPSRYRGLAPAPHLPQTHTGFAPRGEKKPAPPHKEFPLGQYAKGARLFTPP